MKLPLDRERMRERNLLDDIDEIALTTGQTPEERLVATMTLSDLALALFRGNPDAPVHDRLEDLYAELATAVRPRLRRELLQRDFDVPAMEEELERFGVFRSLFRPTNVFVDIFDAQNPLGEAILERRREVDVQGRKCWTAAAEDLAVLKAFSDRARDHEERI